MDVAATGCNICAVGDKHYVCGDHHLPHEVYMTIDPEFELIDEECGNRDHLLPQIVQHLHSIGRSFPPPCV